MRRRRVSYDSAFRRRPRPITFDLSLVSFLIFMFNSSSNRKQTICTQINECKKKLFAYICLLLNPDSVESYCHVMNILSCNEYSCNGNEQVCKVLLTVTQNWISWSPISTSDCYNFGALECFVLVIHAICVSPKCLLAVFVYWEIPILPGGMKHPVPSTAPHRTQIREWNHLSAD